MVHLIISSSNEVRFIIKVTLTDLLGEIPVLVLLWDFSVRSTLIWQHEALWVKTVWHWESRIIQISLPLELLHEISYHRIEFVNFLLMWVLLLLLLGLLLLLLLLQVKLSIESVHCLLLEINKVLLIFVLSPELISLLLELLESQLISLVVSHVECLTHASTSLASLGFGKSSEEIVLIVYIELILNRGIFLWR